MMDYKEQINHPKWQKRRLEILSKDNFTCQTCECTDKQLHVHHINYKNGAMIWDYEDSELITLCDVCHNVEHNYDYKFIFELFNSRGFTNIEVGRIFIEIVKQIDVSSGKRVLYNILSTHCNNIDNTLIDKLEKRRLNWID